MSLPIISTSQQPTIRGSEESGGRQAITLGLVAALRFSVQSSGDESPYVKHTIDWGDGDVDYSGDYLPIGREFQYSHDYREVGEYTVVVRATNKSGEVSAIDPYAVVAIRVDPLPPRQVRPYKWRGLALPVNSTKAALAAVETSYPIDVLPLLQAVAAGERRLVFAVPELKFAKDAQVTITQPDKLITSARIVSTEGSIAILDADLNDSYDTRARVEVARRDIVRQYSSTATKPPGWFFPITTDEDLVKAAVATILSTRPGERVFRPDIGSRIHELPFEQNDNITGAQAKAYVPDEIGEQEPRAEVRSVRVDSLEGDAELWVRVELALATGQEGTFSVSVPLRSQFNSVAIAASASSL